MSEAQPEDPGSIDGRQFVMKSSTASAVDPASPTRFWYSERGGLVWGSYTGDTVTEGRFVGIRAGHLLTIQFVHALREDGTLVSGESTSMIEAGSHRPWRLVETFSIGAENHVSVCVESVS